MILEKEPNERIICTFYTVRLSTAEELDSNKCTTFHDIRQFALNPGPISFWLQNIHSSFCYLELCFVLGEITVFNCEDLYFLNLIQRYEIQKCFQTKKKRQKFDLKNWISAECMQRVICKTIYQKKKQQKIRQGNLKDGIIYETKQVS